MYFFLNDPRKNGLIWENIYDLYYREKKSECLVKHSAKDTEVNAESYKRETCLLSAIIRLTIHYSPCSLKN